MEDWVVWRLSSGKNPTPLAALLGEGADPNVITALGTPLGRAVVEGSGDIVQTLLDAGADPNLPGARAMNTADLPPLVAAAHAGRRSIMQRLLDAGADLNGASARGQTPLHAAIAADRRDAVRWLLAQGAALEGREHVFQRTPLLVACEWGRGSIVHELLDAGADASVVDVDAQGAIHLLLHSPRAPSRALLVALAQAGAPINTPEAGTGWTPLHLAAFYNRAVAVRWLIGQGISPEAADQKGQTPLTLAIEQEATYAAAVLLAADTHQHAIHRAAASPEVSLAVVEGLLEQGVAANTRDAEGRSPVDLVLDGWPSPEELAVQEPKGLALLAAGASPSPALLVRAARLGALRLLAALLRQLPASGAALLAAAQAGPIAVLDALIDAGAPLEAADAQGNTALHHAFRADRPAFAERLLAAGADLRATNARGLAALDYASPTMRAQLAGQPRPPITPGMCPVCFSPTLRQDAAVVRADTAAPEHAYQCPRCQTRFVGDDQEGGWLTEVTTGATWRWWQGRWHRQWRPDE